MRVRVASRAGRRQKGWADLTELPSQARGVGITQKEMGTVRFDMKS